MMDFMLSLLLIAVVFVFGLVSWKIPILGIIGTIVGVVTLFDTASTGAISWGYVYNGTAVQHITTVEPSMQTLALVSIIVCFGLTLVAIANKLSE